MERADPGLKTGSQVSGAFHRAPTGLYLREGGPGKPRRLRFGRGKHGGTRGGGISLHGVTWSLEKAEKDPTSDQWHLELGLGIVKGPSGEGGPGAQG